MNGRSGRAEVEIRDSTSRIGRSLSPPNEGAGTDSLQPAVPVKSSRRASLQSCSTTERARRLRESPRRSIRRDFHRARKDIRDAPLPRLDDAPACPRSPAPPSGQRWSPRSPRAAQRRDQPQQLGRSSRTSSFQPVFYGFDTSGASIQQESYLNSFIGDITSSAYMDMLNQGA